MSLKTIAEGFANLAFGGEKVKKVAKRRKNICDACPKSEFGKSRYCKLSNGGCGCYLPALRAAMSDACRDGKWLPEE